tara:strand:- start:101 stop:388 length:288 start_codon:yes stop_codon:yes gene_type:complete
MKKALSTIQLRIDDSTKRNASKVLDTLGLDMSTAIKLYLKQITLHKGLPFPLVTENGFTVQGESEILQAAEEAVQGKNVTKAMSKKQALKYLDLL